MVLESLPETLDILRPPVYPPYDYARSLLSPSSRVLDVGCGNAKVSAYLAESGALVDGIEPTASRADVAAGRVRHLSTVPAGEPDPGLLAEYDLITFFDVVEHLPDPGPVLEWAVSRLAPAGRLLALIPNSAHYSFRLKILRGDWSMQPSGLFDRTHLRFYDLTTMLALQPAGTALVEKQYHSPARKAWQRRGLRYRPSLFALHGLLVWQRTAE
jgi:SAM-dependent methyltransferase